MQQLTAEGSRIVEDVARRHDISTDAVLTLLSALRKGGGTQAQFSHPELGGMGQWSRGGMIMIGDMFNHSLKARVDRLCIELSRLIGDGAMSNQAPPSQSQSQPAGDRGVGLSMSTAEDGRWPPALGSPSSTGSQNDLHYAVFPDKRRLAIVRGSDMMIYDTGDHRITGFSQRQGGDQSITFTSQHGTVQVADLPVIDGNASGGPPDPASETTERSDPPTSLAASAPTPPHAAAIAEDDVLAKIERLATLRAKDVLTAEEFDAKKAELLGRL